MKEWWSKSDIREGNLRPRSRFKHNYEKEKKIILDWIKTENIDEKDILEVGRGEFPMFKDSTKIDAVKVRDDIIEADCNQNFSELFKDKTQPNSKNKFKLILSQYVVGHLWNVFNFFEQCNKLLDSNGLLIVSLPNENYWRMRLNYLKYSILGVSENDLRWFHNNKTFHRFTPKYFKTFVKQYGFKLEDIKPVGRSKWLSVSPAMIAKLRK